MRRDRHEFVTRLDRFGELFSALLHTLFENLVGLFKQGPHAIDGVSDFSDFVLRTNRHPSFEIPLPDFVSGGGDFSQSSRNRPARQKGES